MKINNYLITRFNIPMGFRGKNQEVVVPDEKWMEHRMELFLQYCAPSVERQTCKDFTWFIIVHEDTSEVHLNKIKAIDNVVVLKGRTYPDVYKSFLKNYFFKEEPYLTMRLDNDDSLHSEFIETLSSMAMALNNNRGVFGNPFAINFRTGLEHDISLREFFIRDYPSSSFVSVISLPCENHKCVLDYHHAHIHKDLDVVNIKTRQPMWMINIHDKNVGNIVNGKPLSNDDPSNSIYLDDYKSYLNDE